MVEILGIVYGESKIRECEVQCYIDISGDYEKTREMLRKLLEKTLCYNYVVLKDPHQHRLERFAWIIDIYSHIEERKPTIEYSGLQTHLKNFTNYVNQIIEGIKDSKYFIKLKLNILAEIDENGNLKELRTPTLEYDIVTYLKPEDAMKKIIPKYDENPVRIGFLYGTKDTTIKLPLEFIWRHCGVFGVTGSGKTNTLFILCEELSKHGIPIVAFAREPDFIKNNIVEGYTEIIDVEKLKIPLIELDIDVINHILGRRYELTEFMIDLYTRIIDELRSLKISPSINTIINILSNALEDTRWKQYINYIPEVKDKVINKEKLEKLIVEISGKIRKNFDERTIRGLRARLFKLKKVFGNLLGYEWEYDGKPFSVKNLVEIKNNRGIIKVLDLTGLDDIQRIAILAVLVNKLFYLRDIAYRVESKEEKVESDMITNKFVILVDEIQAFTPEGEATPATDILRKIAQMGRKRGIGLLVATQYPTYMDSKIRRQLVTKIVHAIGVEGAKSLDLHEILGKEIVESLPQQETGVAILVTSRDYAFTPIKMYVPLSKPYGGKGFEEI